MAACINIKDATKDVAPIHNTKKKALAAMSCAEKWKGLQKNKKGNNRANMRKT